MDFVEGLPKVGGKTVILTVVDWLSKYDHFIALRHPYTATTVAAAFFENIVRLHGMLASIVSDRDPIFTSTMWQELFRLCGTTLCTSSAFRPQTDGQSKVTNRIITIYLRCLAGNRHKSWLRCLPWAEYCYNTSYQTMLKATPFEVVYGRPPPALFPVLPDVTRVVAVDRQLRDQDIFLAEVRDRLLQAQGVMKLVHDKQHRHLEFEVGEWAWLRLNQRDVVSIHDGHLSKLAPKYFGAYQVIEQLGSVAYWLQLPPKAWIHNVFHVAFLKKFEGTTPAIIPPLPQIVRSRTVLVPQVVVRAKPTGNSWELLVKWANLSSAEATWEQLDTFKDVYPDFQLEDKLFRQEGENVMDSYFRNQYSRRKKPSG
jgi:hypothetical protein